MITKNDIHTFTIDIDEWKEGMAFTDAKFHHQNCDASQASMWEGIPHVCAGLDCFNCNIHFGFNSWDFLLAFMDHRPIIYYDKGKILRFLHKDFKQADISQIHPAPSTLTVETKKSQERFYLDQLKIVHDCGVRIGNWDDRSVFICFGCCQEFDLLNLDLLTAVSNASIHNITSEIETSSGLIIVKPQAQIKE